MRTRQLRDQCGVPAPGRERKGPQLAAGGGQFCTPVVVLRHQHAGVRVDLQDRVAQARQAKLVQRRPAGPEQERLVARDHHAGDQPLTGRQVGADRDVGQQAGRRRDAGGGRLGGGRDRARAQSVASGDREGVAGPVDQARNRDRRAGAGGGKRRAPADRGGGDGVAGDVGPAVARRRETDRHGAVAAGEGDARGRAGHRNRRGRGERAGGGVARAHAVGRIGGKNMGRAWGQARGRNRENPAGARRRNVRHPRAAELRRQIDCGHGENHAAGGDVRTTIRGDVAPQGSRGNGEVRAGGSRHGGRNRRSEGTGRGRSQTGPGGIGGRDGEGVGGAVGQAGNRDRRPGAVGGERRAPADRSGGDGVAGDGGPAVVRRRPEADVGRAIAQSRGDAGRRVGGARDNRERAGHMGKSVIGGHPARGRERAGAGRAGHRGRRCHGRSRRQRTGGVAVLEAGVSNREDGIGHAVEPRLIVRPYRQDRLAHRQRCRTARRGVVGRIGRGEGHAQRLRPRRRHRTRRRAVGKRPGHARGGIELRTGQRRAVGDRRRRRPGDR